MMIRREINRESAVSPVIGVMLMLVVVIIIAAIVSAFGGSITQTEKKAPQASFSGSYSQMNGLAITHLGGDSLETEDVKIFVRPSAEFGHGQSDIGTLLVNATTLTDGTPDPAINGTLRYWKNGTYGTYSITSWKPGETMYVRGGTDLQNSGLIDSREWPPCYNEKLIRSGGTNWCFVTSLNNQYNIGKRITIEIMRSDGKLISSFDTAVAP